VGSLCAPKSEVKERERRKDFKDEIPLYGRIAPGREGGVCGRRPNVSSVLWIIERAVTICEICQRDKGDPVQ